MAEVTNDLIYEVLKAMQSRLDRMDHTMGEVKNEIQAVRTHMVGVHQDLSNIYLKLDDHGTRLERIETRLGLLEPAH
jgi:DNA repair ATPase RecN